MMLGMGQAQVLVFQYVRIIIIQNLHTVGNVILVVLAVLVEEIKVASAVGLTTLQSIIGGGEIRDVRQVVSTAFIRVR